MIAADLKEWGVKLTENELDDTGSREWSTA